MKEYVIQFEIYGLKGKATVKAPSREKAEAHVMSKLKITDVFTKTPLGTMKGDPFGDLLNMLDGLK